MSISPDQDHGYIHNMMGEISKESAEGLKTLPGLMHRMLKDGGWRILIRPIDGRRFENQTIEDWVLGPAWPGLDFPDWVSLYAMLKQNIEHGQACITYLAKAGAPPPVEVDAEHLGKRAIYQGRPLTRVEAGAKGGRGHKASGNTTSFLRNTATHIMRRLLEQRPDLFEKVRKGEISANAAAIQAGFRKGNTPLNALRKAWKKATEAERQEFLNEIQ